MGPGIAAFTTEVSGNITSGFALIGVVALLFGLAFFLPSKQS